MQTPIEQHARELHRLAIALAKTAQDSMSDWEEVFYEACYADDDSGVDRAIVRSVETRMDVHPLPEVGDVRASLKEIRESRPNDKWRCISMHLTKAGDVDVQDDYDPNCVSRFFADYENQRPF